MGTHHDEGNSSAKDQSICSKHPNVILPLHHPLRNRNLILPLLWSIRIPIFRQIIARHLIRQALVRLCQLDKLGVRILLRLILGQLYLIRMTICSSASIKDRQWDV